MSDQTYPRVIVVSAGPISTGYATGITLAQLFADWPRDRLAQLYVSGTPDEARCSVNWQVSPHSFPVDHWARRCLRLLPGRHLISSTGPALDGECRESRMHLLLRAANDMVPPRLSGELEREVHDFQPDLVYATLGSLRMFGISLAVSSLGRWPIVPHFMDDWLRTLYAEGPVVAPARHLLHLRLRQVLRQAPFGMTICSQMAAEYERRYGLRFAAFSSCIEPERFSGPSSPPDAGGPPTFLYAGGLHLERWRVLGKVATEVSAAGYKMDILAPAHQLEQHGAHLRAAGNVRLRSVPFRQVDHEIRSASVLVHVESFKRTWPSTRDCPCRRNCPNTWPQGDRFSRSARPILPPCSLSSTLKRESTYQRRTAGC